MPKRYRVNLTLSKSDYDLLTKFSSLVNVTRSSILFNFAMPTLRDLSGLINGFSNLPDDDEIKRRLRDSYSFDEAVRELMDIYSATVDWRDNDD